eukprot:1159052-Pelagomonas_calceolata.AAC.17
MMHTGPGVQIVPTILITITLTSNGFVRPRAVMVMQPWFEGLPSRPFRWSSAHGAANTQLNNENETARYVFYTQTDTAVAAPLFIHTSPLITER